MIDQDQQRDHAEEAYNETLLRPMEDLSPEEQQEVLNAQLEG